MNSHIVVGVGNIYACESLFHAGINPKREAGKVSKQRLERLVAAIRNTLAEAIRRGGTTLRDFTAEDGKPGYFAQQLNVYGRAGEACPACGNRVKKITQQNRSTFYCPRCQR
jgi:formamidopyrimidine-DNA glycosylase